MFKAIFRMLFGEALKHDLIEEQPSHETAPLGDARSDWWAFSFPPSRPAEGKWQVALPKVEVAGTQHRLKDVSDFVLEVQAIVNNRRQAQLPFSVFLEAEPRNRHDRNAVKVVGRNALTPADRHLGYLPRDIAAGLQGAPLPHIEAVRYFEHGDYNELKINLLKLAPTPEEKRAADAAAVAELDVSDLDIGNDADSAEIIRLARTLKRVGRSDDAATVLERLIQAQDAEGGAPPAAWKMLAIIYRQRKDRDAEIALLERFEVTRQPGGLADELHERLMKLKR